MRISITNNGSEGLTLRDVYRSEDNQFFKIELIKPLLYSSGTEVFVTVDEDANIITIFGENINTLIELFIDEDIPGHFNIVLDEDIIDFTILLMGDIFNDVSVCDFAEDNVDDKTIDYSIDLNAYNEVYEDEDALAF